MLQLGITLSEESIIDLFQTAEYKFDTLEDVQRYLEFQDIGIFYLDKGCYLFGFEIKQASENPWAPGNTFSKTMQEIQSAQQLFFADVHRLKLSLENITIDFIESGSEVRAFAEPTLIEF